MRFNPRVIEAGGAPLDEEGELCLPDDLRSLAEQLHLDAAHLASCYPAETPAEAAAVAQHRTLKTADGDANRGVWRRRLALTGAGLVSLSLLGALAVLHIDRASTVGRQETARRQEKTGNRDIPTTVSEPRTRDSSSGSGLASTVARMKPSSAQPTGVRAGEAAPGKSGERAATPEAAGELSPIMFLQEVTAPELEGWCDLIEEGETDGADLSI